MKRISLVLFVLAILEICLWLSARPALLVPRWEVRIEGAVRHRSGKPVRRLQVDLIFPSLGSQFKENGQQLVMAAPPSPTDRDGSEEPARGYWKPTPDPSASYHVTWRPDGGFEAVAAYTGPREPDRYLLHFHGAGSDHTTSEFGLEPAERENELTSSEPDVILPD